MVTPVLLATENVVTVKVAVVWVAATVTLAGTVAAAGVLLLSVTTAPPVGAGAPSVTVPCELIPPTTLVGFRLKEATAGVTVSVAGRDAPLYEAVIVTWVVVLTAKVVTVKVRLVCPELNETLAGTLATVGLLLESVTVKPPLGAAAARVTVPVELFVPTTLVGLNVMEESTREGVEPTLVVGSAEAYFRTRTLLYSANVLASPYSATLPDASELSVPVISDTPSL
jgi:hypothetical protein